MDSTSKFKATISDYIFFIVMFTPFDLLYFYFIFSSSSALVFSEELANMSVIDVAR